MGFSGHIKVTVLIGAVVSVVSIQTSGVIWVGRLVVVVLCNYKEHLEAMPVLLFVYRAAMHVGGLASGWKGVELSIGFLTCLELCSGEFNCHYCIFGDSKVSGVHVIAGWIVPIGNIQSKDLVHCDMVGSILYEYVNQ